MRGEGWTDGRPWVGISRWVLYRYLGPGPSVSLSLSLPASTPVDSTPPRPVLARRPGAATEGAVEGEKQ